MKPYLFVGMIAILAMVLAVPVMAVGQSSATVELNGTLAQSLEISVDTPSIIFPAFGIGENFAENAGTLTVTSKNIGWTVDLIPTPADGKMESESTSLTVPLNQFKSGIGYISVLDWGMSGDAFTTITSEPLSYKQVILPADPMGEYEISLEYIASPV